MLRVSAYAMCIRDGRVLLARWLGPDGVRWTLPGGGIDHGEHPHDAAIREVEEETGYAVVIERLLGIDSVRVVHPRAVGPEDDHHGLRIVYEARVVGGTLRHEIGGSTDRADWFDLDRVADLDRVPLVDAGLRLAATRPPTGRLPSQED